MTTSTTRNLRRHAQDLRRDELIRIARAIAIKWSTFWKVHHAAHPSKVSTPSHP